MRGLRAYRWRVLPPCWSALYWMPESRSQVKCRIRLPVLLPVWSQVDCLATMFWVHAYHRRPTRLLQGLPKHLVEPGRWWSARCQRAFLPKAGDRMQTGFDRACSGTPSIRSQSKYKSKPKGYDKLRVCLASCQPVTLGILELTTSYSPYSENPRHEFTISISTALSPPLGHVKKPNQQMSMSALHERRKFVFHSRIV